MAIPNKNNNIIPRILDVKHLLSMKSFFLFGPRSVGKSTLVRQQLKKAQVYDLLDDETYESLLRRPKIIEESLDPEKSLVVIDEIQRLPKLLNEVHRLIYKKNLLFLLTGSSARKLRRGASNLLGGRAWEANLYPLTTQEIQDFDLLKYLNIGGLPHVYLSSHPNDELKSYVSLYLREEIVAEALVRKVEHFLRFLDVIALNNGEELHYQGLSNDTGVQARTLQNYVQILEDTHMGFQVTPFLMTKKRKAITRSKFYLFDLGVVGRLAKRSEIKNGSELFGRAFEHFIAREIKSYLGYNRKDEELYYWRSTSGYEVDFIIDKKIAIEVKATDMVSEGHLKGLFALQEEKMIKDYIVVSQDSSPRMIRNIQILPWKIFLDKLWKNKLI